MIPQVRTYIEQHNLLPDAYKRPVIVGLSGGADSVALLVVLERLGYRCIAAHCNFHLRGEESGRDEAFVGELTASLGVGLEVIHFDTHAYAGEKHISIEMAARELRYDWFEQLREKHDAQAIAVGHHRDDNVETILMNLVRGTGIRGMRGMLPRNGQVVRPLLAISREGIVAWLEQEGYSYVTDSTNLSDEYTRNFIRLRLIPLLEELSPAVRDTITRSGEHLAGVEIIYKSVLESARREVMIEADVFSIPALMLYPSPDTILYELLKPYGFNRIVAGDIFASLSGESGREFYSSDWRLVKDRDKLLCSPRAEKDEEDCYTILSESDFSRLPIELSCSRIVYTKELQIDKDKCIAWFDYDKLRFPLQLRRWRKGDWFVPFGMTGRKKLSDYFTDQKFSLIQKENTWLLCSDNDIVWIVGERTDNRYRVNHATKQAFIIKKMD